MATTRAMLLASALLLCCSIVDALSHDAGMIAPRRCIAPRVRAPLTVMGKSKKQDDLAAMMAAAQAQREGRPVDFDLPEPKPKPNRQKLQPKTTTKAVKSRADMLNLMKSAQASATGLGSGLADAGKEKRSAAEMRGAPAPTASPPPARPAPPVEGYDRFQELLKGAGKSSRSSATRSVELLPRGTPLPLPPNLGDLDGVPNGYASLEALAGDASYLVLLASSEPIMADKWRQTLVAFASTLPVAQLDANVAAVSRVPCNALRKQQRKAGVSYALLSDPNSKWLSRLKVAPDGGAPRWEERVRPGCDALRKARLCGFSKVSL